MEKDHEHFQDTTIESISEAVIESAKSSRFLILVITFASILVVMTVWNSSPFSWLKERIKIAQNAWEFKAWEANQTNNIKMMIDAKIDTAGYDAAMHFYAKRGFGDSAFLREYINDIERIYNSNVRTQKIPVFGVLIDLNDIGLWAGITFTIILLWFRFHSRKELTNLCLVFKYANDANLNKYYLHMAARQVFTVPKTPDGSRNLAHWRRIMYFLLLLPVIVQTYTVAHDVYTSINVIYTNQVHSWVINVIGAFFLGLILLLTASCWSMTKEIDNQWDTAAKRLGYISD